MPFNNSYELKRLSAEEEISSMIVVICVLWYLIRFLNFCPPAPPTNLMLLHLNPQVVSSCHRLRTHCTLPLEESMSANGPGCHFQIIAPQTQSLLPIGQIGENATKTNNQDAKCPKITPQFAFFGILYQL